MDIILGGIRQFVIDDKWQQFDVEPARRDIGRHQHVDRALFEVFQSLRALALGAVAVDGGSGDTVAQEFAHQAVGVALGAHEHQRLLHLAALDQMCEQGAFAIGVDLVHLVRYQIGRRIAARDFHRNRRTQYLVGEPLDFVREGGGEQQVLSFRRQQRDDALDVGHETHVEHAVGFIEHEDFDARQVDRFLLHVIEQAAGRGDQYFDAGAQCLYLRIDVDTAIDHGGTQRKVLAVVAHAFFNLRGKLARRREYQRADGVAGGRRARVLVRRQHLQNRQCKAGGFAGAGLRATHDVLACQHRRNCF